MIFTKINHLSKIFERKFKNTIFLSKHKVLDQLAEDLICGLDEKISFNRKIVVCCGIHNSYHLNQFRRGYKLGIQTEQFLNQEGQELWRYDSFLPKVLKHLERFDKIIDINASNKPVYDRLPDHIKHKVTFGPHIFPAHPPPATTSTRPQAAFVGDSSGRRTSILATLESKQQAELIKSELYGKPLLKELSPYAAILNIHYDRGSYTEAPRLLLALKAGKAVISEPLSDEFTEGVHYLGLDKSPDQADLAATFRHFSAYVCNHFSFQDQLIALGLASLPMGQHEQYTG